MIEKLKLGNWVLNGIDQQMFDKINELISSHNAKEGEGKSKCYPPAHFYAEGEMQCECKEKYRLPQPLKEKEEELMREIYDCPCHCHKTSPSKDCECPTLTCEHCVKEKHVEDHSKQPNDGSRKEPSKDL